jgi:hypothetical protein
MFRVRLPTCSIAAAETALAHLWCALEAHGLPSPEIEVEFGPANTVTLSLELKQATHALIFFESCRSAYRQAEADGDPAGLGPALR